MKYNKMKCPSCGNELPQNSPCSKCGEKRTRPGRDIEVEYKEFKVSEFLEIRKTQQAARGEETEDSRAGMKDTPFSSHAPAPKTGIKIRDTGSKKLLAVFLFIIIVLLIIAGGGYLLRVLFQK